MALKAVVYPQTQDPFGYGINKDFYNFNKLLAGAGNWIYEDLNNLEREEDQQQGSTNFLENQTENNNNYYYSYGDWNKNNSNNNNNNNGSSFTSMLLIPPPHHNHHFSSDNNPLSAESNDLSNNQNFDSSNSTTVASHHRPKRRRAKSKKNKEQIENQRMTHIAVERNRRKQMNEYLSVLRSLMPDSYVQRGDQASIIGGAINFVKELEQRMQFLGSHQKKSDIGGSRAFCEFFTFPQYSSTTSTKSTAGCDIINSSSVGIGEHEVHPGIADIEVTTVESHANLKIRSKKRPKQLLKIVSGLHNMRLTILHLNVTTTGEIVLYSLSVKVEDDCKLGSVDDIAAAVYQLMDRIQQEAMLN